MEHSFGLKESRRKREKFLVVGTGESGDSLLRRIQQIVDEPVDFLSILNYGEVVSESLGGADMVFVIVDVDSQTDVDLASSAAETAKAMGKLTVSIMTAPGSLIAWRNAGKIGKKLDALFFVENDKPLYESVAHVICGVVRLAFMVEKAAIPIDFKDIEEFLKDAGTAIFTTGAAKGGNRAEEAAAEALKQVSLPFGGKAKKLIVCFRTDENANSSEFKKAFSIISEALACENARCLWGHAADQANGWMRVEILAAGFVSSQSFEKIN
jgi:cell division protein FtsZ